MKPLSLFSWAKQPEKAYFSIFIFGINPLHVCAGVKPYIVCAYQVIDCPCCWPTLSRSPLSCHYPEVIFWAGGLLPIDGPQVNASSLFWSLPLFLLSHKARGLLFLGFCQYDMARQPNSIVPVSSDKENIILFFECITLLSPSKVSHRKLRLLRVCISEVTSRLTTLCTMLHTVSSTLSLLRAR